MTHSAEEIDRAEQTAPSSALMHFGFLLTGLGTMLLGPILPLLARRWHLNDAESGLLLLAQFCGSFAGGVTVGPRLRAELRLGLLVAGGGLLGFAGAWNLGFACFWIAFAGAGIGRSLTVISILAGQRWAKTNSARLMRLNLIWSFGAMLSPLLAAWLTPRLPLYALLDVLAAMFLVCAVGLMVQSRGVGSETLSETTEIAAAHRLDRPAFLFFAAMILIYGGLETCLNGWLTTFSLRYGMGGGKAGSLASSEYTLVLLLIGLTVGRALASIALQKLPDRVLQRVGLGLAAVFTVALATAGSAAAIAVFAVLLGLSLAPVYPATFSLMMAERPTSRQAAWAIAASALGAAGLPWAMGVISTRTGSLQIALCLPFAAAAAMLGLSLLRRSSTAPERGV